MLTANPFQEEVQDAGLLSEVPWQCQIATPQLPIAGGNAELKRKNRWINKQHWSSYPFVLEWWYMSLEDMVNPRSFSMDTDAETIGWTKAQHTRFAGFYGFVPNKLFQTNISHPEKFCMDLQLPSFHNLKTFMSALHHAILLGWVKPVFFWLIKINPQAGLAHSCAQRGRRCTGVVQSLNHQDWMKWIKHGNPSASRAQHRTNQ